MSEPYEIEHFSTSPSNPGKVMLTVKSQSAIIYSNQLDLTKEQERLCVVSTIVDRYPHLHPKEARLTQDLLELANVVFLAPKAEETAEEVRPLELSKAALAEMSPDVVSEADKLLREPRLVEMILEHINRLGVVRETSLALAVYLIATSRLLKKPLAAAILGSSSSGKSFCPDVISKLIPDEAKLLAHVLTPKALNYLPCGHLEHRMIFAGERSRIQDDVAAEATRSLREMVSDGVLRLATVQKNHKTGLNETVIIEQPGPIGYIETTTLALNKLFDEDRTRFMILGTDESPTQTVSIMSRMAKNSMSPTNDRERKHMIALHHAMQRLLQPMSASIPYAACLVSVFPSERVEARRAFKSLLGLISAVTLLHQRQRIVNSDGRLVSQPEDYEVVRRYLSQTVAIGLGHGLTPGAQRVLGIIAENYGVDSSDMFTIKELAEVMDASYKTAYPKVSELCERGFLLLAEPGRGNTPGKYQRVAVPKAVAGFELPEYKDLITGTQKQAEKQTLGTYLTDCI